MGYRITPKIPRSQLTEHAPASARDREAAAADRSLALLDTAPFCRTARQQPGLHTETLPGIYLFLGRYIHADGLI